MVKKKGSRKSTASKLEKIEGESVTIVKNIDGSS